MDAITYRMSLEVDFFLFSREKSEVGNVLNVSVRTVCYIGGCPLMGHNHVYMGRTTPDI